MVLQEPGQRQVEAPLGKTARAAMAGRAPIGEKLLRRLAGIEILRDGNRRRQDGGGCNSHRGKSHKGRDHAAPRSK
jgi:hypothetical protein